MTSVPMFPFGDRGNRMRLAPRSSGILLHPTSLPGGRLGEEAYRFVDWLVDAGQSWWQMLPLGPPDELGSPYRSASAFACSAALLGDPDAPVSGSEIDDFARREAYWAPAWAEFAGPGALADQVRFEREWRALRSYAAERGVWLIGDVPIYVAPDGADQQEHPSLFEGAAMAGCPPDDWSDTGQLWGNPLYDWGQLRRTGYRWWIERFRRTLELFDAARLDHFRGFVSYWSVPEHAETALHGTWKRGPGRALFDAAERELGELPLIAEDLGVITPAVDRLRDELDIPGTVVLHFLLQSHDPLDAVPVNRVVYTGTHDNDTSAGWWETVPQHVHDYVWRLGSAFGIEEAEPARVLARLALASRGRLAILPVQDVLGLDSGSRMNTPGTAFGNWGFRLEPGQLDAQAAAFLRDACAASGRDRL